MTPRVSENVACTIVSKNYLSYARVLARSFHQHHPDVPFVVLLCDTIDDYFDPRDEPFDIVLIDELPIPNLTAFCFQYTVVELNTAAKPYFLEYLLRRRGYRRVLYFDPDIFIFQSLTSIFDTLASCSIALTPHLTRPLPDDGKLPNELTILQAGAYNLGFIGLRDTPTTQRFLSWWQARLLDGCRMDIQNGMHVDQKWIDLVPGLFGDVHVFREQVYNVAYWNIPTLTLTSVDRRPYVDGVPAVFMHFSGIDPNAPDRISKHDTRLSMAELGTTSELFHEYMDALVQAGYFTILTWPYAYGQFTNHIEIPPVARRIYIEMGEEKADFGNPFDADRTNSYFRWLTEPAEEGGDAWPGLSRILAAIYRSRVDLPRLFPEPFGKDHQAFIHWAEEYGRHHYQLAPVFLQVQARSFLGQGAGQLADDVERVLGVNVSGCVASDGRDGQAARSLVHALESAGIPTVVRDARTFIDNVALRQSEDALDAPHAVNLMLVGEQNTDWLRGARDRGYFAHRYNIVYIVQDALRAPIDAAAVRQLADEVWVGSTFLRHMLEETMAIPVRYMPYPIVDRKPVPTGRRQDIGIPRDCFVFLATLKCASSVEQQNPWVVIQAFKQAFSADERAVLLLSCLEGSYDPYVLDDLRSAAAGANVRILDSTSSRNEALTLLLWCDCFVSLHRVDAFGLSMAEAMLMEKPVIATGYSGNMDFMNEQNGFLVRYRLVDVDREAGSVGQGRCWAEPDAEHAAELMRYVYDHRAEIHQVGRRARREILANVGTARVGQSMRERLVAVVGQLRRIGV